MVLGGGENIRKGSRLNIRYISQEKRGRTSWRSSHVHGDKIHLQSFGDTGKHQELIRWMHLPLKGLVVTKDDNNNRHRIPWKKKKKERIYLKKVSVTDVQADSTFTCIDNSQLDIPKRDSWVWLDCKQWRDSLTKSDIQVDVEFEGSIRTLTVDAEDPVIVIMHKMRDRVPCHIQVLTYKGTKIKYPADTVKDVGIKDGDQLTLLVEENRKNIPDVWEGAPIPIMYAQGGRPTPRFQGPEATSYKGIVSLPFQDIQSMGTKYPELKMDEARVKQILESELYEDEYDLADISPVGFQQLMEALGKKVDLDDILKAVVTHEDNSDEDDQFSVLDMMTSSFEGRSLFKDGDPRIDASTADRIASLKCMMNPGPLRTARSSPFSWLNDPDLPYTDASNNVFRRLVKYGEIRYNPGSGHRPQLVKLGPPEQKTLPTVPGFLEEDAEEASELLQGLGTIYSSNSDLKRKVVKYTPPNFQGLHFKRRSEESEIAAETSEVESVNLRCLNRSDVQLSGLDDLEEDRRQVGEDKDK